MLARNTSCGRQNSTVDTTKTNFKTSDRVIIKSNDLEPQYIGKVGKVKKVYLSFTENGDVHIAAYRVEVDGPVLKGIAFDSDLELAK